MKKKDFLEFIFLISKMRKSTKGSSFCVCKSEINSKYLSQNCKNFALNILDFFVRKLNKYQKIYFLNLIDFWMI